MSISVKKWFSSSKCEALILQYCSKVTPSWFVIVNSSHPALCADFLKDFLGKVASSRWAIFMPQNYNRILILLQLMTFCQFVGTNAFYHLLRDARGPSAHTVFRVVHRVADALISLKPEAIRWPEDCSKLPAKFYEIGGFPQVDYQCFCSSNFPSCIGLL